MKQPPITAIILLATELFSYKYFCPMSDGAADNYFHSTGEAKSFQHHKF